MDIAINATFCLVWQLRRIGRDALESDAFYDFLLPHKYAVACQAWNCRVRLSTSSFGFDLSTTMSTNPYSPPTADVAIVQSIPQIPPQILKKIKGAWVAGVISGCMTLLVTLLAVFGTRVLGFDAWNLIDVVLIFGLTFGIYKRSRVCAVSMLVYFVTSKIIIALEGGKASGVVLSLVFLYFYAQGIVGTFAYHKLIRT